MTQPFDPGPYDAATAADRKPVSLNDYWGQSWHDSVRVSNLAAEQTNLREVFNATNDRIAKATGVTDLQNPTNFVPTYRAQRQSDEDLMRQYQEWKQRIRDLQKLHPDALPWDDVISEPERTAYERMKSIRHATSAMEERLGMYQPIRRPWLGIADQLIGAGEAFVKNLATSPVTTLYGFSGQFLGQFMSPEDALTNALPFGLGKAGRSIIKNAINNAISNMVLQAPLSYAKQPQYERAGLPSGWEQWLAEVSGAGAAGFVLDASFRGGARAYKFARGRGEGVGGLITDAPREIPLPPEPAARPEIPPDLVERARNDDLEAIKELARRTGADQDPVAKGALDYAELGGRVDEETARFFRENRIDDGEGARVLADVINNPDKYRRVPEPVPEAPEVFDRDAGVELATARAADLDSLLQGIDRRIDERVRDAVEAGIPRIVNTVRQRLDEMRESGDTGVVQRGLLADLERIAEESGGPERLDAMVRLHAGRGDLRETVATLRRFPDLMDSNVRLGTEHMQAARAIATLEAPAYARFAAGDVPPGVARVVADMVPREQQARVIDDMARAGADSESAARAIVHDLVRRTPAPDESARVGKVSDPAGPEAKAQSDLLAKEHAETLKEAAAPIKEREKLEKKIEDLRAEIAKLEKKAGEAKSPAAERFADPQSGMDLSRAEVDTIVDMWAYVRDTLKRKPESLSQWVMSVGRLQDQGGELTNMLGGKSRHLISGKGMLLDDAALKAYETGYFAERPDISTFLEAVRDDLRGDNPVVRAQDFNWLEDYREARKMEQDLDELGVVKAKSEQEVRDILRVEQPEGTRPRGSEGRAEDTGRPQGEESGPLFALSDADLKALAEKRAELRDLQANLVEASRGSPLFDLVLEAAQRQRVRDLRAAVDDALRLAARILPEDAGVTVRTDPMVDQASGRVIEASTDTVTGDIALAAYALNPAARLGHEAVHALVTRGLLAPEEVRLLAAEGRKAGLLDEAKEAAYRQAYEGRAGLEALIEEEHAAHYIEAILARKIEPAIARTLIDKIRQLIERIRNVLDGNGFRSAEDVVRAILEGEAAERRAVQRWMRSTDLVAVSRKPDGGMYALAGEKARTADLAALDLAMEYERRGVDRDAIWRATGWGRGRDKRWRFEIDDYEAGFTDSGLLPGPSIAFLSRRLRHPELYAAYPRAEDFQLKIDPNLGESWGQFDPYFGTVSVSPSVPPDRRLGVVMHEVQHGLQYIEGFVPGGSPSQFTPRHIAAYREFLQSVGDTRPYTDEFLAVKLYEQIAGEVEARLVDKRMNMTPLERRARPFWHDYDFPEDSQLLPEHIMQMGRREAMFALADGETGREMRRELDALGYYSQALEAAKALKQAKGTPEQMRSQLRKAGVKEAELAALGFDTFLEGKKSVTKDEIVSFLRENRVEVREAVYGEPLSAAEEDRLRRQFIGGTPDAQQSAMDARRLTKWARYSIDPSNPTYRETVIYLPVPNADVLSKTSDELKAERAVIEQRFVSEGREPTPDEIARLTVIGNRLHGNINALEGDFTSGHWSEPNVIAHARTSLQKTADGKTVFLVDELQSDWGQKIRDGGARDEAKIAELKNSLREAAMVRDDAKRDLDALAHDIVKLPDAKAIFDRNQEEMRKTVRSWSYLGPRDYVQAYGAFGRGEYQRRAADLDNALGAASDTVRRIAAELRTAEAATPGHPLVNTTDQWTTTAFRRLIRQAVEAGADAIALTPASVQYGAPRNFGTKAGMEATYDSIYPRTLSKLLAKMDPEAGKMTDKPLHSSVDGRRFEGNWTEGGSWFKKAGPPIQFHTFPLTDKVKAQVSREGQALFALGDLDMSPEARKARAEAMGFDTSTVWYHGTRRGGFDAFSKSEIGSNFAADERGFFFINDPKQASEYANNDTVGLPASDGSVIPAYLKTKNPLIVDDMFLKREGMQPIGKTEDVISFWDNYQGLILEWADKNSADAVVLVDNSYRQKGPNAGQPTMLMVVFDPANIRSVNAAFDPAESASPRLMAALGDAPEPVRAELEAVSRLEALKELAEACA